MDAISKALNSADEEYGDDDFEAENAGNIAADVAKASGKSILAQAAESVRAEAREE
jgi:hypothetical protein